MPVWRESDGIGKPRIQLPRLNQTVREHYSRYFVPGSLEMDLFARQYGDDVRLFGYTF